MNRVYLSLFEFNVSQVHPGVGIGPYLVRGEAAVGRRPRGIRERHVERDRLRNQLLVRGHRRSKGGRLLQGQVGDREIGIGERATTRTVGHVGPDAHIRGALLRRQHIQVYLASSSKSLFTLLPVNFAKRWKKRRKEGKKKKNVIAKRFWRRPFARRLVKNPRDAIREIALST